MEFPHIKPYLEKIEERIEKEILAEDQKVYGLLVPFLKRGGKRIRPVLTLLCAGVCGGAHKDALDIASIIEMFHNFTLIHDDIEDNSEYRRGEPALHISHGIPMALNSADALYTYLWKKLVGLGLSSGRQIALQNLCAKAFKRVVDGQGIEIFWIKNDKFDISENDYLEMIGGKTAALMGLCCEAGAFCAKSKKSKRLGFYGEKLGLAFQIQDDVLNLTGDFSKYQKEIGGDITEGKRTLMVVHTLKYGSEADKKILLSILKSHTTDQNKIKEAIEIMKKYDSINYASKIAANLVNEAKAFITIFPKSEDKFALMNLADYVINREK